VAYKQTSATCRDNIIVKYAVVKVWDLVYV